VTNLDDQQAILDVFRMVLVARPQVLLVLAPRHPEVRERMEKLESFLQERDFDYVFRSRLKGAQLNPDTQVLVLDTLGELKDFYAVATLTYVGPNHNVLEPLAFDKPVFVKPGWEATYPSYPVYRLLLDNGAIVETSENRDLARAWMEFLTNETRYHSHVREMDLVLSREMGATKRALDLLAAKGFAPGA
jgi:3-deoxy-D-manno-octulosonic-acid transferase